MSGKPFSVYLHIPYCRQKCPYCDFNTYAVAAIPEHEYVKGILAELSYRAALDEWRSREIKTIYFGGGTPSLFGAHSIFRILSTISVLFPIDNKVEISLEANPGTIDNSNLPALRESGINRLSIGAQSFNTETLRTLGREHTSTQTEMAILNARNAGFSNINIDLMHGVPNQTIETWINDIDTACSFLPDHISVYGLTIEKGTPFYRSYRRGLLKAPREEILIAMMENANSLLIQRGFHHYEISNFSKPGREARHNLTYWNGDDYLGIGAGAHSYLYTYDHHKKPFGRRHCNFALPSKYINAALSNGLAESWSEQLSLKDAVFEFFFLGLRKTAGVSLREFELRFGLCVDKIYPAVLAMLAEQDLISMNSEHMALTNKGLLVADSIIEHFSTSESSLRDAAMQS